MSPLLASLVLAVTPISKPAAIDVDRMIEAICEIEGGSWGVAGGAGCLSYIAWEQYRPKLSYQLSARKEHAIPVYREHILWLAYNIPRNHVKLTPASLYTCWHLGLRGGTRLLREGPMPDDGQRCQNIYDDLGRK